MAVCLKVLGAQKGARLILRVEPAPGARLVLHRKDSQPLESNNVLRSAGGKRPPNNVMKPRPERSHTWAQSIESAWVRWIVATQVVGAVLGYSLERIAGGP